METLEETIAFLNRAEVKNFQIFANRSNINEERKDLQLFEILRKFKDSYSDEDILELLYPSKKDKNAYYRLRNRLCEDIQKSLFLHNIDEDQTIEVLYLLGISTLWIQKNRYKLAFYQLKKAEKKALSLEGYTLLDNIYTLMIQASREILSENPEVFIKKRKENRDNMMRLSHIEDVIEAVEYRMKIAQNLENNTINILELLNTTINEYAADLKNSQKLQLRLYFVVSRKLFQQKNYTELETYLTNTYQSFEKQGFLTKANHTHKLQIISWITNALFMNKKYKESLDAAQLLHNGMQEFDKMLYDKYEFFYFNALIINYSVIQPKTAISILLDLQKKENIVKIPFHGIFVYMNLAYLYYQEGDLKSSLKYISRLNTYHGLTVADDSMKMKVALAELVLRMDLKDKSGFDYKLKSIKKDLNDYLDTHPNNWDRQLIRWIEDINKNKAKTLFQFNIDAGKRIVSEIETKQIKEEMLFPYNEWIRNKIDTFKLIKPVSTKIKTQKQITKDK